jgi:hypothetical protein
MDWTGQILTIWSDDRSPIIVFHCSFSFLRGFPTETNILIAGNGEGTDNKNFSSEANCRARKSMDELCL